MRKTNEEIEQLFAGLERKFSDVVSENMRLRAELAMRPERLAQTKRDGEALAQALRHSRTLYALTDAESAALAQWEETQR